MVLVNRQVGKNAFFLYIRMIFLLIISLYTSRIIIEKLGAEDYGLYNLIGGVISLFTILRGAFSSATQRFLNVAIGQERVNEIKCIFNISSFIYLLVGILFILLIETVGLWFLYNKLVIPIDKIDIAFWVFQISATSVFFSILTVPYDSIVIAYQKMNFYALVSIIDAIFRLAILYLIFFSPIDALITYAFLLLVENFIIRIIYLIYSRREFEECKYSWCFNSTQIKEISVFAGWNVLGIFTFSIVNQGINILLNMFGGVILNASQGIASQVNNGVMNFLGNVNLAFKPYLIELYAQNKKDMFYTQILFSSKCNVLMFLFLALPIYIFINQILAFWLTDIPNYTVEFVQALLFYSLMRSFHNPIEIIYISSGKLKTYQLIESVILFLALPLIYVFLKLAFPYYIAFVIMGVIEAVNLMSIAGYAYYTHQFPLKIWSLKILIPTLVLFLCSIGIDSMLHCIVYKILLVIITYILLITVLTSHNEREELKKVLYSKIKRK